MQVIKAQLTNIGRLQDTSFLVPEFLCTPPFRWGDQVDKLLSDICENFCLGAEKRSTFIGNIVVTQREGRYELLDGKNRLLTGLLILCALRAQLSDLPQPARGLLAVNKWIARTDATTNATQPRIELENKTDDAALQAFIQAPLGTGANLGLLPLLQAAYERIALHLGNVLGNDPEALAAFSVHVLTNTDLIVVEIKNETQPQSTIFESLNATGTRLSQADLAPFRRESRA